MSSNIKTWQDTSDFLRATPFLSWIYALDIDCRWKKFDSIIISMFHTKLGPWPQKRDNWLLGGFIRYSSAVWCNMLHTSLDDVGKHQNVERPPFSVVRYHEAQEDANPGSWRWGLKYDTSCCKLDSNRFNIILYIVCKRWCAPLRRDLKIPRSVKPKSSDALRMGRASICASQ